MLLGKTSLLMALLGEMHCKKDGLDSFLNLPREGGVAFCAQEAWIQNASIKVCFFLMDALPRTCIEADRKCQENLLFGSPFEESRYKKGTSSLVESAPAAMSH